MQKFRRIAGRSRVERALAAAIVFAVPVIASAQAGQVGAYSFTADRLVATIGALAALVAAVSGGVSLTRAARGRGGALSAIFLAVVGLIVGLFIVITADGGLGTGNGVGGGYVAIALSLIGFILGGLALGRGRKTA